MRALEYFIDRDRRHATMIDWTITQHARGAVWRMTNDLRFKRERPRRLRVCWTEDNDRWTTERRCDVRRTRVVCDYEIDQTEHGSDLIERGFPSQHDGLMSHSAGYLIRNVELVARADQQHLSLFFK